VRPIRHAPGDHKYSSTFSREKRGVQLSRLTVQLAGHIEFPLTLVPRVSKFYDDSVDQINRRLRALCVGRHPYLAEHFARCFSDIGLDAKSAKGLDEAASLSREFKPDIVICEYELLAIFSAAALRRDKILLETPIIAVSLTRGSKELPVANMEGVESFLYLPTLGPDAAAQAIFAATNAGNEFRLTPPGSSRIDEVEAML